MVSAFSGTKSSLLNWIKVLEKNLLRNNSQQTQHIFSKYFCTFVILSAELRTLVEFSTGTGMNEATTYRCRHIASMCLHQPIDCKCSLLSYVLTETSFLQLRSNIYMRLSDFIHWCSISRFFLIRLSHPYRITFLIK